MHRYLNRCRYQILLLLFILVGYFPVAFQLLALKNDIIQLDLPVKYFISKEFHRGEFPVWMYSWSLGFPLGHLFTWSAYNPVTLLFTIFFYYDVYTLHLEFMFYIILGAFGIWKISRHVLIISLPASLIAASAYALSGITLSCSQFLAYIASIGFLPWVFYFFIKLLLNPSLYRAIWFSLIVYLLISWSYPAATIISFYALLCILFIYFVVLKKDFLGNNIFSYLFLSSALILLLASPLIYITVKTLPQFSRSEQLSSGHNDFGYLDPSSFLSLLYPFENVDKKFADTTFLFQNIHVGTLGFGMLLSTIWHYRALGRYRKIVFYLFLSSLFALIISCGNAFLLKGYLDQLLPGFRWFRFPSFFRLYFLLAASLLIGIGFDQISESVKFQNTQRIVLMVLALSGILSLRKLYYFKLSDYTLETILANNQFLLQIFPLICLVWVIGLIVLIRLKSNNARLFGNLMIADLIFYALLSLPIYTVGSYTLQDVHHILNKENQTNQLNVSVNNLYGPYTDKKGNTFNNLNVYANIVSAKEQYVGPLYLKSFSAYQNTEQAGEKPSTIIYGKGLDVKMINDAFKRYTFSAEVTSPQNGEVILFQLWHPFWKAYINGKEVPIRASNDGLIHVDIPSGSHEVSFTFKDNLMVLFTWVFFISITLLGISIVILKFRGQNV